MGSSSVEPRLAPRRSRAGRQRGKPRPGRWLRAIGWVPVVVLPGAVASCGPADPDAPASVEAASAGEARPRLVGGEEIWTAAPDLPAPVTNNAVAAVELDERVSVFSFLGLDSTRVWSGVTDAAYRWDEGDTAWTTLDPVPGPGRLAATAQVVDGLVYLLGGYTVAADGSERSVPDVNVLDPRTGAWTRGADIPVPADDAVSGVWRDSLVVLVSGWHDTGNVRHVQIYDPFLDEWSQATPIPGTPVFGHTGAVAGNHVVYVDGTAVVEGRPRFAIEESSWAGRLLDGSEPAGREDGPVAPRSGAPNGEAPPESSVSVAWREIEPHPGPPFYRAAGGVANGWIVFVGGSSNPYNYDGIGYDRRPSEPLRQALGYDPERGVWSQLPPPPTATMDHRNAPVAGGRLYLVGGMREGQRVSDGVWYVEVEELLRDR